MYIRSPEWKKVDNAKRVTKTCPRCHNASDFSLVYDVETFMFVPSKVYALHCPICIYVEDVDKRTVKSFIEA